MINGRYHLQSKLGQGGMGIVHRALDQLTGDTVALKQVQASLQQLQFMSKPGAGATNDLRLALAREFQTLATLRHPHIISVLDFGFTAGEAEEQPFYTMAYLPEAETLLQASNGLSHSEKFNLIQQVLQGLAYLHRRGILHRDLKPENILVTRGQARLLDFGLAISRDETSKISSGGSLAYLSPELWLQKPASRASDLYAVGITIFQILTGVHPFAPIDAWFTNRVLNDEPNWEPLLAAGTSPDVIKVIQKLLLKEPTDRYQRANEVTADLQAALGQPVSKESEAIRESYLQAAEFVGRETEMSQLIEALDQAKLGPGAVWLIGGESGVGKSRLLDEVRAQALVSGWQVMGGQAEADGGLPYQLWQEIIPRLVLNTALSELELGILRQTAPAVDKLLADPVPEPHTLNGGANQQRLVLTLQAVLQRQSQPTLLLLEDLQWASESLAPIKHLLKMQNQTPGVMVLATYRNEERPNLPEELVGAKLIQLKRLPDQQIAKLGQAMLGHRAVTPKIISLLVKETEGNTFFIVEVMRALAEEAGQLEGVGLMDLPTDVLTSGMKQLLQRRIQRIPAVDQPLLQFAAVSGRVLDQALLQALAGTTEIDRWLQRVSETAVLTVHDNQWQFAHDKLREAILVDLAQEQRGQLHRQVAEAIETTYPDNKFYYVPLLEHWHQAGDLSKEINYLPLAFVETVFISGDYERAGSLITRTLATLPEDHPRRAKLQARQVYSYLHTGKVAEAVSLGLEALELAREFNDQAALALTLRNLGLTQTVQGAFEEALAYFDESISIYEVLGDQQGLAMSFNSLANIAHYQGQLEKARDNYEKSLALHQAIDNQHNVGRALAGLALVLTDLNDNETAETYLRQSLDIFKQIGDRAGTAATLINLGFLQLKTNQDEAQNTFHQALVISQTIQMIPYILEILVGFAWLFEARQEPVKSAELAGLTQHHPAHNVDIDWRLNGLIEKLGESLAPDELESASARGQTLDLDKTVQKLLQEFSDAD